MEVQAVANHRATTLSSTVPAGGNIIVDNIAIAMYKIDYHYTHRKRNIGDAEINVAKEVILTANNQLSFLSNFQPKRFILKRAISFTYII